MRKLLLLLIVACYFINADAQLVGLVGGREVRTANPKDGGSAGMSPSKNIVENIAASGSNTNFLMLLQSGGLTEKLSGPGPYTVFMPSSDAFTKIPSASINTLTETENKKKLTDLLNFHIVAGRLDAASLSAMVKDADGTATLTTLAGIPITVTKKGKKLVISDGKNLKATIQSADIEQSNGIIHVIDKVLMAQ